MTQVKRESKKQRFIGTYNNPGEHTKDFMLETWLEHLHKTLGCVYTAGQLEKGEQGTPHV